MVLVLGLVLDLSLDFAVEEWHLDYPKVIASLK